MADMCICMCDWVGIFALVAGESLCTCEYRFLVLYLFVLVH